MAPVSEYLIRRAERRAKAQARQRVLGWVLFAGLMIWAMVQLRG